MEILDFYAMVYEELLALPVIKGQKTGEIPLTRVGIRS
jgi:hypothetical protein